MPSFDEKFASAQVKALISNVAHEPVNSGGMGAINHDIGAIKDDVVGLAHNIEGLGRHQAHQVSDYMQEQMSALQNSGQGLMNSFETQFKASPIKTTGFAFAAGILASYLLLRR